MVEKLIFTVLAFVLFILMFLKMIKKNDTNYFSELLLQFIGIVIGFIWIVTEKDMSILVKGIAYLLAVILPILVFILQKRGIDLISMVSILEAKAFFALGNNKAAKSILLKLVEKQRNNYYAHKLLAEIYQKEGGMRRAIDQYVQVIEINKKDYDSYYKIAFLLNELEKPEEASQMLNNLLIKKPDYYKASELLGDILVNQERYKEAVNIYQDALKYNPLSFEINYNLGIVCTMLNDFQNAKEYFEKAAELNSLNHNSKYSLAEIALIYKELEEAEKLFLEALEDPELEADAYYELAKICLIRGEKEKAINYANIAIESNLKKIADKIQKNMMFMPIYSKLTIPFNLDVEFEEEKKEKLTLKEKKAKEHLEEMFEIIRKIGYDDIKLFSQYLKNEKQNRKEENINIDFVKDNQKEIQD